MRYQEKGYWSSLKRNRRQILAQLLADYNTGPRSIVSSTQFQLTLLDMRLLSKRLTNVPLLTKESIIANYS